MLTWDKVQQMVRQGLMFVAGYLVSKGVIDAAGSELFVGAGVAGAAFLWWLLWDRKRDA